jgi:phytanoyl-CoA hydroxylase
MSATTTGIEFLRPDDERLATRLDRDGVVFVADLLTPDHLEELKRETERYKNEVLPTVPGEDCTYDGDGQIRGMTYMHAYSPWFKTFGESATVMGPVRAAVDWEPMLYYVEAFVKPPSGPPMPPHQELYTSPVDPVQYVQMWIALEDISAENGSLTFYRGSHKFGLAPHVDADEGGVRYVDDEVMKRIAKLRLQPDYPAGSAALFDCRMIHESPRNLTSAARPALALGYRGVTTVVPTEEDRIASRLTEMFAGAVAGMNEDDDFFEAGGDDALADTLAEQVSTAYAVRVSRQDIGAAPSPRLLARHVVGLRGEDGGPGSGS